jgi:CheY-like chemotaxis protein
MGGEMWVDSVQGTGTTFTFTLPYLKITQLPDRKDNPGHESTAYNWTGAGILIVEDDPVSHAFLKELFQHTGADLYHAADGLEAVNQFRKIKNIDLVIMDIQMPEMDGFEATRVIRSMNSNIPVIAQTAFAMSDDKEKMKQAGFDDYVSKPIDINQLLAIVHRWLTRSKKHVTTCIGN